MIPPKEHMDQLKAQQKTRFQGEDEPAQQFPLGDFGPPQFGDEEEEPQFADRDQIKDTYAQFNQELEQPYPDDEEPEEREQEEPEESGYGFTPPPSWMGAKDYPEPESLRQQGGSFLRDDAIFEGGPSQSEVNSWKKQFEQDGHQVMLSEIGDEVFIWRTLNRVEYREIMALPNTDPLQREEIICEVCVLFPYMYRFDTMANRKAGAPAVLAEQIMKASAFVQPTPPIRL